MYYVEIDWSHLIGHSENRSARHPGDIDIPVSWARESAEDGEATLVDPDYNSKTKLSSRLIGYSRSGKLIITVILVRYKASSMRLRLGRLTGRISDSTKGWNKMSKGELDELVRDEVSHALAHEDDPLPVGLRVTHPNRATVLSVRLGSEDFRLLTQQAEREGLPISTQARALILAGLRQRDMKEVVAQALRDTLVPQMIAS